MSNEPRHRIYGHIYQRSWNASISDDDDDHGPSPYTLATALMLDPLEATDAMENDAYPSATIADFSSHPDKNAKQALLETLSTWVDLCKYPSEAIDGIRGYSLRLGTWCLIPLAERLVTLVPERLRPAALILPVTLDAWLRTDGKIGDTLLSVAQIFEPYGYPDREGNLSDRSAPEAIVRLCRMIIERTNSKRFFDAYRDAVYYATTQTSQARRFTYAGWEPEENARILLEIEERVLRYPYSK